MYVSIDMDKLVFLHKHSDHDVVSGLAFLEAPDRTINVDRIDRSGFLDKLSRLDLCMLYKNTCGLPSSPVADSPVLRRHLQGMLERMNGREAVAEEVQAQVALVEADLHKGIPYRYAKGAKRPAAPMELFPMTGKPLDTRTLDRLAEEAGRNAEEIVQAWPEKAHQGPGSPDGVVPPVPVAPDRPQRAARAGSVRPVARQAADDAWAAAGKGTLATWEQVRAALIEKLVGDGYHPTTVRIKLSEWAKENLA